ncbi:MAG: hypothetical protein JST90_19350 [Bacteroidetes bacterium]|nr:hypothetical protein [Bacteroidota bacterium]
MKSRLIHLTAMALIASAILTACDRQPRKTAELQRINDSMEHPHNYADTFNADRQDWENFKIEARARLKQNEDSLKTINEKIAKAGDKLKAGYDQKMITLESRNRELRERLEGYKEEGRDNWDKFKMSFNNDMDTISQNMKSFFSVDHHK